MNRLDRLRSIYKKYNLVAEDWFQHKQGWIILKRSGIEKVALGIDAKITFEVIKCEENFAVVKATGEVDDKVTETFGSALHGGGSVGNTVSHYIIEIAEARALSRCVLKLTDLYSHGFKGEDESEDFKDKAPAQQFSKKIIRLKEELDDAKAKGDLEKATDIYEECDCGSNDPLNKMMAVCNYYSQLWELEEEEVR